MPDGGGGEGGGGGGVGGGFFRFRFAGSRSSGAKRSNTPNEVRLKYPNGRIEVVSPSEAAAFRRSRCYYGPVRYPDCEQWVKEVSQAILLDGIDCHASKFYRDQLLEHCDIKVHFDKPNNNDNGSTSTSSVQD